MQVQIVRASTRFKALSEAKRLFGPDPLVLSVRRRPSEQGQGAEWEAIVARETPEPLVTPEGYSGGESASNGGLGLSSLETFSRELTVFRQSLAKSKTPNADLLGLAHRLTQLESDVLASMLHSSAVSDRWLPLMRRLEAAGYPKEEALRMVQSMDVSDMPDTEEGPDWNNFHNRIRRVIADGLRVAPTQERLSPELVIFTGSTGVGKTTLAAKLAADLCLGGAASPVLGVLLPRKGVGLETVRRCARALDIEFIEVNDAEGLQTLSQRAKTTPVILDSSSVNPLNQSSMKEMKEVLSAAPKAEVHTVVPASYSDQDFARALNAFSWIGANRLSVTRLDEAPFVGRVMSAAAKGGIPIGYLSLGPRIPDDLARPGLDSLIDSVLRPEGALAL